MRKKNIVIYISIFIIILLTVFSNVHTLGLEDSSMASMWMWEWSKQPYSAIAGKTMDQLKRILAKR